MSLWPNYSNIDFREQRCSTYIFVRWIDRAEEKEKILVLNHLFGLNWFVMFAIVLLVLPQHCLRHKVDIVEIKVYPDLQKAFHNPPSFSEHRKKNSTEDKAV